MFTGLVEEVGTVRAIKPLGGGMEISVAATKVTEDFQPGDSIAINGVCQTVVKFSRDLFTVQAVEETLKKTNLGELKLGDKVNLERSLTLNKRLGGHFVMGHVDTAGRITDIKRLASSIIVKVSYPKEFSQYVVNVGAIAVEGISLTIASFDERTLTVSIIPHTWGETNLKEKSVGSRVNLEFDLLGKYVARMLNKNSGTGIDEKWLRENGF